MAKSKTASAEKKRNKPAPSKAKGKPGGKKTKPKSEHKGFEALAKLIDHPLVIDLIAVGATAAVAALADRGAGSKSAKSGRSTTAVKAAGKAAAAAIGKRLMNEYQAIKDVAADPNKKV